MTRKRKIQVHVLAVLVVICLIGWIIFLYTEKRQKEKSQENYILTMYDAALASLSVPLNQFSEATTLTDQLSCLEVISDELKHLSAYLDMSDGWIRAGIPIYAETERVALILIEKKGLAPGKNI